MTEQTRNLLISLASHMAYMQGQLEARHELDDPEDYYWYRESVALRQKVTDALAEASEPTDEELLELMPQQMRDDLAAASALAGFDPDNIKATSAFRIILNRHVADHARAVLSRWGCSQPTSNKPTVMEIIELAEEIEEAGLGEVDLVRAALARWGTPNSAETRRSLKDAWAAHQPAIEAAAKAGMEACRMDEPAVPDGREPASVATEPSDEELLATLNQAVADFPPRHPEAEALNAVEYPLALELRKARAVLARWGYQPAPPAEGEVGELAAEIRHFLAGYRKIRGLDPENIYSIHRGDAMEAHITVSGLTRIAALLERQAAPVPVAVGERWPEFSDCDPSNDCVWCFNPALSHWNLSLINRTIHTHWLPADALPLPSGEVER